MLWPESSERISSAYTWFTSGIGCLFTFGCLLFAGLPLSESGGNFLLTCHAVSQTASDPEPKVHRKEVLLRSGVKQRVELSARPLYTHTETHTLPSVWHIGGNTHLHCLHCQVDSLWQLADFATSQPFNKCRSWTELPLCLLSLDHTYPSLHLPLSEEDGNKGGRHTSDHPETVCVKADRRKGERT